MTVNTGNIGNTNNINNIGGGVGNTQNVNQSQATQLKPDETPLSWFLDQNITDTDFDKIEAKFVKDPTSQNVIVSANGTTLNADMEFTVTKKDPTTGIETTLTCVKKMYIGGEGTEADKARLLKMMHTWQKMTCQKLKEYYEPGKTTEDRLKIKKVADANVFYFNKLVGDSDVDVKGPQKVDPNAWWITQQFTGISNKLGDVKDTVVSFFYDPSKQPIFYGKISIKTPGSAEEEVIFNTANVAHKTFSEEAELLDIIHYHSITIIKDDKTQLPKDSEINKKLLNATNDAAIVTDLDTDGIDKEKYTKKLVDSMKKDREELEYLFERGIPGKTVLHSSENAKFFQQRLDAPQKTKEALKKRKEEIRNSPALTGNPNAAIKADPTIISLRSKYNKELANRDLALQQFERANELILRLRKQKIQLDKLIEHFDLPATDPKPEELKTWKSIHKKIEKYMFQEGLNVDSKQVDSGPKRLYLEFIDIYQKAKFEITINEHTGIFTKKNYAKIDKSLQEALTTAQALDDITLTYNGVQWKLIHDNENDYPLWVNNDNSKCFLDRGESGAFVIEDADITNYLVKNPLKEEVEEIEEVKEEEVEEIEEDVIEIKNIEDYLSKQDEGVKEFTYDGVTYKQYNKGFWLDSEGTVYNTNKIEKEEGY
jgi:hypothetical protein